MLVNPSKCICFKFVLFASYSCKGVPNQANQKEDYDNLDFKLIVDSKSGPPQVITLVASTPQEKAAWTSDISQVGAKNPNPKSVKLATFGFMHIYRYF